MKTGCTEVDVSQNKYSFTGSDQTLDRQHIEDILYIDLLLYYALQ